MSANVTFNNGSGTPPMYFLDYQWLVSWSIPMVAIPISTWAMWLAERVWTGSGERPRGYKRNWVRRKLRSCMPHWAWKLFVGPPKYYMSSVKTIRIDANGRNLEAEARIQRRDHKRQLRQEQEIARLIKESRSSSSQCATCSPSPSAFNAEPNPCHLKIVGPTLGFAVGVVMAVVCWPASLFCGCCATETGKQMLGLPADTSQSVTNAIPF